MPADGIAAAYGARDFGTSGWQLCGQATPFSAHAEASQPDSQPGGQPPRGGCGLGGVSASGRL